MHGGSQFYIRDQYGRVINTVGRDQYIQWQESFTREVFAARTKARVLIWGGFLWTVGGAAVAVFLVIWALSGLDVTSENPIPPEPAGLGYAFIVGVIAAFGQFAVIAGVVLHLVGAARRNQLHHNPPVDAGYRR